jgi:hypothetical protein
MEAIPASLVALRQQNPSAAKATNTTQPLTTGKAIQMGKNTHLGLAGPDDPIYKEGVTMYAKPSFPQQESLPKSKAGTPNSQQLPSQTQDEDTPQDEEQVVGDPIPMDEFLTEEHWAKTHDPEVAKAMVEMGLIKPKKNSTKSTD